MPFSDIWKYLRNMEQNLSYDLQNVSEDRMISAKKRGGAEG